MQPADTVLNIKLKSEPRNSALTPRLASLVTPAQAGIRALEPVDVGAQGVDPGLRRGDEKDGLSQLNQHFTR
ncbi:MAG: hypothetical protein EAZ21_13065 [Betaproteobacteria bacterium]|nr:MAG: hypothetical protein EAZ43_00255 [Betaproteobacteria bacterium]TAG78303.1 MAG: hypothetical protein EAZ21_13065 [Betaproteobacteria bacterium]